MKETKKKEEEEKGASRDGRGELPVKACGSGMNERTGKPNEGRNGPARPCISQLGIYSSSRGLRVARVYVHVA